MVSFSSLTQSIRVRCVVVLSTIYVGGFTAVHAGEWPQSHPTHQFFLKQSQTFHNSAQQLQTTLEDECAQANPSNARSPSQSSNAVEAIQRQVKALMQSWMPLQGIASGPAMASDRYWQVQFWPDKKNTTGRQLSALLKQHHEWQREWLMEQSVAVQGLGALEWLWFDEQATSWSLKQRCQAGTVIAANVRLNAKVIELAWQENPWSALSDAKWKAEALALMVDQLDRVMKKIALPLGKNGKTNPFFAEAWRSQSSLALLKANVTQLEAQFFIPQSGVRALLLEDNQDALVQRIEGLFRQLLDNWPTEPSLVKALESQPGHREMIQRYNQIERLHYLLSEPTAKALGVLVGFNATDGD